MPSMVTAVRSSVTWLAAPAVNSPDPPPTASTGTASFCLASSRISSPSVSIARLEACGALEAARPRVRPHELVDIVLGERAWGGGERRERVVRQERALAAGEQHLRDAGRGQHADVPRAAMGDVGEHLKAESRQAGLDRRVALDEVGARGG